MHVDGKEYTVSGAMPHVEDFLQASILGEDRKRVFMCDLATMNSDDGCRRGDIVYQRERQTWKWMCALYVPSRNEGVFDAMLQELHGLRASSRCFSRVTRMGAIRLYISSESKTEVELCVSRAKELIEWATGGFPAWK